jgi:hypothetical protein
VCPGMIPPVTGPEHYQRAEEQLIAAEAAKERSDWDAVNRHVSFAQAHAQLAAAAATALGTDLMRGPDAAKWKAVAGSEFD